MKEDWISEMYGAQVLADFSTLVSQGFEPIVALDMARHPKSLSEPIYGFDGVSDSDDVCFENTLPVEEAQ